VLGVTVERTVFVLSNNIALDGTVPSKAVTINFVVVEKYPYTVAGPIVLNKSVVFKIKEAFF
jgi:hypothetical protein